jgi:hypothetical protein
MNVKIKRVRAAGTPSQWGVAGFGYQVHFDAQGEAIVSEEDWEFLEPFAAAHGILEVGSSTARTTQEDRAWNQTIEKNPNDKPKPKPKPKAKAPEPEVKDD